MVVLLGNGSKAGNRNLAQPGMATANIQQPIAIQA